jgi:hypothetical protein
MENSMTTHLDQFLRNLVPLADVAKVTHRTVDEVRAECAGFGFFIGIDWAGRPGIDEQEAHQLVTGEARRAREHDAAWAAHLADCARWMSTRDAAVRAAYEAAGGGKSRGQDIDAAARDAAAEVGRSYERSTPVPLWNGEESGNAVRSYSVAPQPGLLARAVGRVKAGAR